MLRSLLKYPLAFFCSKGKGKKSLKQHLQMAKSQEIKQQVDPPNLYLSSRLLYLQFIPLACMVCPLAYFIAVDPLSQYGMLYLQAIRWYSATAIISNTYFNAGNHKYVVPYCAALALINVVPYPYNVLSPLAMVPFLMLFPFTDYPQHGVDTPEALYKMKTYMAVQACTYFFLVGIAIAGGMIWEEEKEIEAKLSKYKQDNIEFYQTNPQQTKTKPELIAFKADK